MLTLTCSIQSGTNPKLEWLKDGIGLSKTENHVVSEDGWNLTVLGRGESICGNYTCVVQNELNKAEVQHSVNGTQCLETTPTLAQRVHFAWIPVLIIAVVVICLGILFSKIRPYIAGQTMPTEQPQGTANLNN
nr:PREDICTED: hemicentin-1-like isoform X1 [Latimeria chalumnae]|eukprot:XP_014339891.1 PREDICTED: hemicentin-1-like isoform X1 [Latimeria chalumnae]